MRSQVYSYHSLRRVDLTKPSDYILWVIRLVDERMTQLDSIAVTDANADLFIVTTSMIATALNHTKAIWVLVEAEFGLAAGPIERALYEVRNELTYLLTQGDPLRNSTKVIVNGALEVADFLSERGNTEAMDKVIAHNRATRSDVVDEIIGQRKARKYHWSRKSHSAIERTIEQELFMYRVLSWEAHAALNSVRDVRTERTGPETARFAIGRSPANDVGPERRSAMISVLMYDMLRRYVATWRLEELPELPPLLSFPTRTASA